jgi:hypothetical protein
MPPRNQPFKNKKAPTAPFCRPRCTRNHLHHLPPQTVGASSPNTNNHNDDTSNKFDERQEDADSGDSEQDRGGGQCQGQTNRETRGLSVNIQRQLIIDISVQGGLEFARLSKLCNSKTDIYGESRSKLRRKIQNTVACWKRLTPSGYQQLLSRLNVTIPHQLQ